VMIFKSSDMKVIKNENPANEKSSKRIPMYKDQAFMNKLRLEFIAAHNDRIRKKIAKVDNEIN
jgi:hypothetical protein